MGGAVANKNPARVWQSPLPKCLACTEAVVYKVLGSRHLATGYLPGGEGRGHRSPVAAAE